MQVSKPDPLAGVQSGQDRASPVRGSAFGNVFCLLKFIGSSLRAVVSQIKNLSERYFSQKTVVEAGTSPGLQPGTVSVNVIMPRMSWVAKTINAKVELILAEKRA